MKKRILVTGADGFIGSRLVSKMRDNNFEVLTHSIQDGDITGKLDFDDVHHVFHLAALTGVPESWKNPYDFYRINVLGTVNVLELCRRNNASLTFPSTYVYGKPQAIPVSEDQMANPSSPYNHSKLVCESVCEFYSKAYGLNIVVLRPFNIYGPGQSKSFIIPTIINQILDQDIASIQVKDLAPKRDYVYVDDLVQAMILTIEHEGYSIYNIGSGYSLSVEEIITSIENITNIYKPYTSLNERRENEVMDVVADIKKIKAELGWSPSITWEDGISRILKSIRK